MKPLPWIAMGLTVLLLTASIEGYDLLANPLGWGLILLGIHRLTVPPAARGQLTQVAVLAALVSLLTWPAPVVAWLQETDASLVWAVSLPQVGFAVLLCHRLAEQARTVDDIAAARWLAITRTLSIAAALLPALVFGAGLDGLEATTEVTSVAAPVLLLVLLVTYRDRAWAGELSVRPG